MPRGVLICIVYSFQILHQVGTACTFATEVWVVRILLVASVLLLCSSGSETYKIIVMPFGTSVSRPIIDRGIARVA